MKVIAKLSTRLFNSDAVRDAFVNGWVDAGRHNRRLRKRYAVVLPWLWADSIRVEWDADEPTPAGLTDAEPQRIKSARLTGPQSAPKYSH